MRMLEPRIGRNTRILPKRLPIRSWSSYNKKDWEKYILDIAQELVSPKLHQIAWINIDGDTGFFKSTHTLYLWYKNALRTGTSANVDMQILVSSAEFSRLMGCVVLWKLENEEQRSKMRRADVAQMEEFLQNKGRDIKVKLKPFPFPPGTGIVIEEFQNATGIFNTASKEEFKQTMQIIRSFSPVMFTNEPEFKEVETILADMSKIRLYIHSKNAIGANPVIWFWVRYRRNNMKYFINPASAKFTGGTFLIPSYANPERYLQPAVYVGHKCPNDIFKVYDEIKGGFQGIKILESTLREIKIDEKKKYRDGSNYIRSQFEGEQMDKYDFNKSEKRGNNDENTAEAVKERMKALRMKKRENGE